MELEIGSVVTGKVTGIVKFGAFVSLPSGKSGLVHISEVANTFVGDVNDFLKQGQEVQVKILSVDPNGRINLSVKQAAPQPERKEKEPREPQQREAREKPQGERPFNKPRQGFNSPRPNNHEAQPKPQAPVEVSFEDKLKKFMQDSDSKISGSKLYSEKRTSRRRNNRG